MVTQLTVAVVTQLTVAVVTQFIELVTQLTAVVTQLTAVVTQLTAVVTQLTAVVTQLTAVLTRPTLRPQVARVVQRNPVQRVKSVVVQKNVFPIRAPIADQECIIMESNV